MSKENLKIVERDQITPENVYACIKDIASSSAQKCEEAKVYLEFMQNQHSSIAKLMQRAEELKGEEVTEESKEELESIMDATVEIMQSLKRVKDGISLESEAENIDDLDAQEEFQEENENEKPTSEQENFSAKFLSAYNKHKNRLGLKTQEEVAELTGIDRRYISNIERAKYRPQFKTIKRFADAFGADISEFI